VRRRHGVQVGDEIEVVSGALGGPAANGAEMVAEMNVPGWRDTGKLVMIGFFRW
jgi:hypothetical protein